MLLEKTRRRILANLLLILCLSFSLNTIANQDVPPPVSITFFGPVSEDIMVRFKCTVVVYGINDATGVAILLGEQPNMQTIILDKSANFVRKDFKTPSGDIVSALEWSGYAVKQEITETSPAWLHEEKGMRMDVTAVILKGKDQIAYTQKRASFHPKALQAIIKSAKHNSSLKNGTSQIVAP